MASKKQPIVIGLDFGTTHSGMAWAPGGSYSTPVSGWPARLGANSDKEKAPSALVYRSNSRPPFWGYSIPPDETPIKWFKLLLLDDDDLPQNFRRSEHLRRAKMQIQQNNRHPVEVIGDYLREMWKHGFRNIEDCLGKRLVSASRLELVVTLPAIWPLYARQRMREAVQLAGILDDRKAGETILSFISEPEAAALATMEDFSDMVEFKKNDRFVVCDAGGGTVDLISYKVIRENPPQVRECVQGDGKLCGAVCLDERFFQLLKSKLPRNIWDRLGKPGIDHIMDFHWENGLKVQFHQDSTDLQIQMPYGGTLETRFHPPRLDFSRRELMDVFKPIVAEVVELVFKQIREVMKMEKRGPKYVILAGGFGKSRVLRQSLQDSLDTEGMNTEILQARGDRPWTAVCRGAVLRGFNKCSPSLFTMVDGRVARASYGTTLNILPWDASEHDSRDRVWCNIQREFLAVDQTQWFIQIGETLATEEPVTHSFWQDFDQPQDFIETEIVYCTAKDPPSRCDDSVKRLCLIRWSKIPSFDKLPVWINQQGGRFRQVHYELRMVPDGASLDFEVFYDGTMVGSRNVQVDCTDSGAKEQRL
ncbi:actin-like ATPase domain-containing protein [Hirsutella rhossiliensis]|uniref:Actin-like ATPase domain-containing protein n=1 Tax=Hirsutella rhossiliensis TaxID=111463 RepID=A0A9P8MZI6_9HYPO|nr:actin-like ATPase domain-containing protein [Hirsutella rhossiliensis]KAH0963179.1 actin-like ATPase domain-containing protein [Hirsutella rhossiliensis]